MTVMEEERRLEREQLPATSPQTPMMSGCGPHCRRTADTRIYHCGCKQCHG